MASTEFAVWRSESFSWRELVLSLALYPQPPRVGVLLPACPPLPSVEETQKYENSEDVIELSFNSKDPMFNTFLLLGSLGFQSLPIRIPV